MSEATLENKEEKSVSPVVYFSRKLEELISETDGKFAKEAKERGEDGGPTNQVIVWGLTKAIHRKMKNYI